MSDMLSQPQAHQQKVYGASEKTAPGWGKYI